jgi:hypothetical protein
MMHEPSVNADGAKKWLPRNVARPKSKASDGEVDDWYIASLIFLPLIFLSFEFECSAPVSCGTACLMTS